METAFELNPSSLRTLLSFSEGGRRFSVVHILRTPKLADWLSYESRLGLAVERDGQSESWNDDREGAAEAIWDAIALSVEGYLLPAGSEDAWKQRVPVAHKLMAINKLAQVSVAEAQAEEAYSLDSDQQKVYLEARRGGLIFSNLAHVFRSPTALEKKSFRRMQSSILRVRGSRTDKSIFPSRLKEMVRFYDDLILDCAGYSFNGAAPSRHDIVGHMDALHKKTAVHSLFTPDLLDSDAVENL